MTFNDMSVHYCHREGCRMVTAGRFGVGIYTDHWIAGGGGRIKKKILNEAAKNMILDQVFIKIIF